MRVLVTGGTGFIGRRLMALLLDRLRPEEITCLVTQALNERESRAEQAFRAAGVHLISGDLARCEVADAAAPDVDVVFHLAANIDTAAAMSDLRVNDLGIEHLLNWLGDRLRGRRVMYASSIAVVDRNGPARAPIHEATPCTPRTAYGVTKLSGERVLRNRAARGGFSWTILRLPTVYGPGQKPGGMFDLLLGYVARGALLGRLQWPGRTSVVFVDDVARVLWNFSQRADVADELFCLASDESSTLGDVAQAIGRVVGRPVRPISLPSWMWSTARALCWNHAVGALVPPFARVSYWRLSLIVDHGFWFDTAKFRRAYREPLVGLDDGLRATIGASDDRVRPASPVSGS